MNLLIFSIPFTSSITLLIFGRYIGIKGGKLIAIMSICLSTLFSFFSLIQEFKGYIYNIQLFNWFKIGSLNTSIDFIFDKESLLMCNLISIITFVVIVYSYWYLSDDPHINRFVGYLLIFSVSMFVLVTAKNFLVLFIGWEGVGIVSYLLINYWFLSPNNNKSSIKALLFNKLGDISFLFSFLGFFYFFNSFDISFINHNIDMILSNNSILQYIIIGFILAAIAKSAQIFLHPWLGDAMAGPTPVSALLHAATMVTAGIFLLLRINLLLPACTETAELSYFNSNSFIVIIGLLTILFAGLSSIGQYDIKKVIAYSTCAQIGYMFFTLSQFFPNFGSLFHLITHGFFKALLFLSAGLLIHNFLNEQDLRKYGNFSFLFPLFSIFILYGSLAIIAFPPLSGYFSKESILLHTLINPNLSTCTETAGLSFYILLLFGSLLSFLYSYKLLSLTFFNKSSISQFLTNFTSTQSRSFNHLYLFLFLLLGSLFIGFLTNNIFLSPESFNFQMEFFLSVHPYINSIVKFLPFILPFFGGLIFLFFYLIRNIKFFSTFYKFLTSIFNRRFFFDSLYNNFLFLPSYSLSYHFSFKFLDRGYLEFLGPVGVFRLFYSSTMPDSKGLPILNKQSTLNLSYNFYYFFLSVLSIFIILIFIG